MSPHRLALGIALLAAPAALRAGEHARLPAVAGDLAGTGEPLLVVAGFRDADGRAVVPVIAQRNGGWQVIARGAWPGARDAEIVAVEIADVSGDERPDVIALGRSDGRARLVVFELAVGSLVPVSELDADARAMAAVAARHGRTRGAITWPRAQGDIDLAVRDALSGPRMARTVLAWDDELARLAATPR
jgi:hypothetical protein